MSKLKDQNGFGIVGIFGVIAVVAIMIAVGWFFWQNFVAKDSTKAPAKVKEPVAMPVASSRPATDSVVVPSSPTPKKSTPPSTNSIVVQ